MLDNLLLLSGNDIPFPIAKLTIHQPSLKEIGYIGEEYFFTGCELLNFSKDSLSAEDKSNLKNKTNFDILMSIMNDKSSIVAKQRISAIMVLSLIFPTYRIKIGQDAIVLSQKDTDNLSLNNKNYEAFKEILVSMFCLQKKEGADYNPVGERSSKIADKLRKRHEKLATIKNESKQKISVLNRYASILAVGLQKDINSLMQYTIYQLNDEFQRFDLREKYGLFIQMKLARVKDVKDVDNWMEELHS